jgi:hypothetical protein
MPLSAVAISNAIEAITVPGVRFLGIGSFADANYSRDVPAFVPNPDNWLSGSSSSLQTFGTSSTRFWFVERNFSYLYIHSTVGSTRTLADNFISLANNMDSIWESLLELDIADTDIVNVSWSKPSTVTDPSGNQFIGVTCTITTKEKVNA